MTIPLFLRSGFRFFERPAVSDVQTIIDDFEDEALTVDNPDKGWYAWTSLGGGGYRSPVDEYNRHFDVYLSRTSQQKLQMEVRDQNNVSVCTRRINCPSANSWLARIFTGPFHVVIDVMMGSAQPEGLCAGMLDLSPDPQDAHTHYVYGGGSRSSSDVRDGYSSLENAAMVDDATPTMLIRMSMYMGASSGTSVGHKTMSGARVYRPRELWCKQTGAGGLYGYLHYAGKCYQQLLCPATLAKGAKVYVPIDAGVLGEFIVAGGIEPNNGSSAWALCVRSG